MGHVTTEIIPVSTTVCPITEGSGPKPTGIIVPTWQPQGEGVTTSKTSVTNTQFTTVTVANPDKPATWPTKPAGEWPGKPAGEQPSVPSKPAGIPVGAAKPSASGWGVKPGSTSAPVTAGAGRNSAALGLSALAAVLFFAL